jgi:sialic acid synthase SpsE
LIRDIARRGLPMIVSTGLGTKEEIAAAVATIERERPGIRAEGGLLLMHCIAAYPAPREDANLRNISWLKDNFGYPVGYSDHTFGIKTCELAVAAGAVALEKHFTYRREGQDFHDHKLSAEPAELKQMIEAVREAELLLGRYERHLGAAELANLTNMRRSLGAARDLSPGMELAEPDIELLRPQWAFRPDQISGVVGRKLARTVAAGDLFKEEDFA